MQLPDVKSRQVSQSVRGTAPQTAFCAVSFLDETLYLRQARSAATVHRRYHSIILLQPLPFGPAPMAIELPSDIWIVDAV